MLQRVDPWVAVTDTRSLVELQSILLRGGVRLDGEFVVEYSAGLALVDVVSAAASASQVRELRFN